MQYTLTLFDESVMYRPNPDDDHLERDISYLISQAMINAPIAGRSDYFVQDRFVFLDISMDVHQDNGKLENMLTIQVPACRFLKIGKKSKYSSDEHIYYQVQPWFEIMAVPDDTLLDIINTAREGTDRPLMTQDVAIYKNMQDVHDSVAAFEGGNVHNDHIRLLPGDDWFIPEDDHKEGSYMQLWAPFNVGQLRKLFGQELIDAEVASVLEDVGVPGEELQFHDNDVENSMIIIGKLP